MNSESTPSCKLIDGKKISQDIQNKLHSDIDDWIKKGHRAPCLIAILVGEDPASQKYVSNKMIAAQNVAVKMNKIPMLGKLKMNTVYKYKTARITVTNFSGIVSKTIRLPQTTTEKEIILKIEELNNDSSVDGILVQLPVPEHVSERNVCNAVDPSKDVDGFHITNMGRLTNNMHTFVPCTALAVIELIKRKVLPKVLSKLASCETPLKF